MINFRWTPNPDQVLTAVSPGDERGARIRPFDRGLTRRIWDQMANYPGLLTGVIILAVALAGLNVAIPYVLTEAIRGPIGDSTGFEERFHLSPAAGLSLGVGMIVVLAVLWYLVMRTRQWWVNLLGEYVVRDLRSAVFCHLQRLGMDFYDRTKVGRIVARGTSDIQAIRGAVMHVVPRTLLAVVQMIGALAFMLCAYDLVLGLALLAFAPVLYLVNWYFRQRLSSRYRLTQESYSILTANLAESILGIRVTQSFSRQAVNARMFDRLCNLHRARHMSVARVHGLYIPMLDIASQIFIAVALVLGGWRVSQNAMTVGDLLGFMVMTGVFFQPITVIGDMYNLTLQAMAGAERVFRLLDTKPAELDPRPGHAVPLPRTDVGMHIEFRQVTFGYTDDRPILHDVSFTVNPGQTVALVGHTGSGKTSIVNLMSKFYRHNGAAGRHGRIFIDGIDIENITQADLHQQMGIVLQENILFSGTVMDNIRFARPEAENAEVIDVCRRLGCLDVLMQLHRGLETEVGERGEALSMGQRQLVCFARAMLARPRLLICDEATSSVDTVTEDRVQHALGHLLEGRTSFVIAHRLSTIRRADLILVVQNGRIVEQGTHAHLLALGGTYSDLHAEFIRVSQGEQSIL